MFTLTLVTILCFYFLHPSPVGRTEGLRFHSTWNWMYKKKEREPLRRRFGHDMTWNRFMGLRFTSQVRQLQICVFSLCSDWSIFFCPYGTILRHIFFLALGLSLLYNWYDWWETKLVNNVDSTFDFVPTSGLDPVNLFPHWLVWFHADDTALLLLLLCE